MRGVEESAPTRLVSLSQLGEGSHTNQEWSPPAKIPCFRSTNGTHTTLCEVAREGGLPKPKPTGRERKDGLRPLQASSHSFSSEPFPSLASKLLTCRIDRAMQRWEGETLRETKAIRVPQTTKRMESIWRGSTKDRGRGGILALTDGGECLQRGSSDMLVHVGYMYT